MLRDIAFSTPYSPQELGTRLRMERHEIDNCARPTDDLYEQKFQVYYYWKQTNGKRATNRALLTALGRCLPRNQLFLDKVNQTILGRTETNSTEGIVQSDAPRVSVSDPLGAASTSEPVQQPMRSSSDNVINEGIVQISCNMLDISILNNRHLTHEMKRYIESNRQLRRANSVLIENQEIFKTKLTEEWRRRSIAEERLVKIEEERNKYMFENVSLHARIGQLEQGENQSDTRTTHQYHSTDEDTCASNASGTAEQQRDTLLPPGHHLEHPLASIDASMLPNITGYNSMPLLQHHDYSPFSIPSSQLEQETASEETGFQVLPSSYHSSSNSNSFYNTSPPPPPPSQQLPANFHTALLPQSIHSAQSHLSFTNVLNSPSYSSYLSQAASTQISCSQQGQEQSLTNSTSQSHFIDGRVSFHISNLPPVAEPPLHEGSIVEDSLVPETICSSLSTESQTQTTPVSSCNDRAPEPVILFDESTQLEWPNYHN